MTDEKPYAPAQLLAQMWDEALADVRAPIAAFAEAKLKWGFRAAKYRRRLGDEQHSLQEAEDAIRRVLEGDMSAMASDFDWQFRVRCNANDVVLQRRKRVAVAVERVEAVAAILESLTAKREAMSIAVLSPTLTTTVTRPDLGGSQ